MRSTWPATLLASCASRSLRSTEISPGGSTPVPCDASRRRSSVHPNRAAWRLAEVRGFDFPASVRPCSLARTTPRASCLTLGVLSLVLRVPQHTAYPYIYQMVSVCIIEDKSALVSVWSLNAAEDSAFCMAFTQLLASSVTATIAARMPSWRTGTSRKLRRLSASSSVSSMVIMTADPPRLADDGVHAPPRRWCLRPRRSEVQRVRRSAPHLVGPAQ